VTHGVGDLGENALHGAAGTVAAVPSVLLLENSFKNFY